MTGPNLVSQLLNLAQAMPNASRPTPRAYKRVPSISKSMDGLLLINLANAGKAALKGFRVSGFRFQ